MWGKLANVALRWGKSRKCHFELGQANECRLDLCQPNGLSMIKTSMRDEYLNLLLNFQDLWYGQEPHRCEPPAQRLFDREEWSSLDLS